MNTRVLPLLLCLLFFTQFSLAQIQLTGTVIDKQNAPLEFANVVLRTQGSDYVQGGITDEKGRFSLAIKETGDYSLTIGLIGYEDWKQALFLEQTTDIGEVSLSVVANELGEITVTAKRAIIQKQGDKLLFNVDQSPLKTGYDGMEVLERSPQILIGDAGEILLRNEAATVLINGQKSNLSAEELANYVRSLRSEEIKTIEVQNTPSASMDAGSAGGIINIVLKRKAMGFNGTVRADLGLRGAGNYQTNPGLNFNYGAQHWNVYGAYDYRHDENDATSVTDIIYYESENLLRNQSFWENIDRRHSYRLGFVVDALKNHVFGVEGFASNLRNNVTFDGRIAITNVDTVGIGRVDLDDGMTNDLYNLTANYTWKIDSLGSNLKLFGDYSIQNFDLKNNVGTTYSLGDYTDNAERNNSGSVTTIYGVQADYQKYFKQDWQLDVGAKLSDIDRENSLVATYLDDEGWQPNTDRSTAFNYSEQVLAAYFTLSKRFLERNFIKIGLRVENTNLKRVDKGDNSTIRQQYVDYFPSLYYSHDFEKGSSLSFSYTRRLNRPAFFWLNNNVIKINDFTFELGNPDLRPEYQHRFNLTFQQAKQSFSAYAHLTVEAINGIYYLEDDIAYYQKFNAGIQKQYGIDYNRFGNLFEWWYFKGTIGLYHRRFTNEQGEDDFKRSTVYLTLINTFKLGKTTSFELSGRYHSPLEDAYYMRKKIYRVDAMLQQTFLDKRLTLRLYLRDAFNFFIFESERPFDDFNTTYSYKPRSRMVRLSLSYNFSTKNKVNNRENDSKNDARRRL